MKKLFFALALLVFGWVSVPGTARAETHWVNYGADQAYTSRAAAIADAPRVHRQAGLPEPVVVLFQEAMKHPGKRVILSNGMRLDYMRTGPTGLWRDVVVAFRQIIARMLITAPAEEWSVTYQGVVYTTGIPDICFNLYGAHVQVPATPGCVEVPFTVPVGVVAVRWGVGSADGPLEPDACNAQQQGNSGFRAWYGDCDICVPALGYLKRVLGPGATVPHKYLYQVTERVQTLRFSEAIWSRSIYICLEYSDGRQTCGVYINPGNTPGTWNGRHTVVIDDRLWQVDRGNCPT